MCEQDSCGVQDKLSNRDDVAMPDDLSLSDSDPEEEPASVAFDPEVIDLSDSDDSEEEEEDDDDDDGLQICGAQQGGGPGQRDVPGSTQSPFSLKGGTSDFSSRSRSIFDTLDTAAKLTSSQLGQDNVIDGVFARPPPPPPLAAAGKKPGERPGPPPQSGGGGEGQAEKGRGVPDYLVHPERWTCYNLEDVAETSDGKNSAVAHQYIQGLQQRKERETTGPEAEPFLPTFNQAQTDGSSSPPQHKIIFSRPSRAERDLAATAALDQKATGGTERGKGLSHLEEEEEEEGTRPEEEEGTRPEAAADKGMDLSKEVKEAKESEGGATGRTEREEDGTVAIAPPQAKQRKRRWGQQHGQGGEGAEQQQEKKQSDELPANAGFVSFRKINRKNYRRTSSSHEED